MTGYIKGSLRNPDYTVPEGYTSSFDYHVDGCTDDDCRCRKELVCRRCGAMLIAATVELHNAWHNNSGRRVSNEEYSQGLEME
jgi:hypothetical protein